MFAPTMPPPPDDKLLVDDKIELVAEARLDDRCVGVPEIGTAPLLEKNVPRDSLARK